MKNRKPTEFEMKVYEITSKIPLGNVSTYKKIAEELNSSPRAVGNALAKNPFAPKVPCHRVVKTNGEIGGFNGSLDNEAKIRLLKSEGISLTRGKIVFN